MLLGLLGCQPSEDKMELTKAIEIAQKPELHNTASAQEAIHVLRGNAAVLAANFDMPGFEERQRQIRCIFAAHADVI